VGAAILGVSPDPVDSHERFSTKYGLNFPLLADIDAKVATAYGVWAERSDNGRTYMRTVRTTFVIDREGIIRHVFPNVKVDEHADRVLEVVRSL
jgi:peroxiredoxin Q/BCP